MKEPQRIPLSDSEKNKEPKKIPLTTSSKYDIEMFDDLWQKHDMSRGSIILSKKNEDNKQDNSKSISKLDSLQGN
jgi:hypothetical protein